MFFSGFFLKIKISHKSNPFKRSQLHKPWMCYLFIYFAAPTAAIWVVDFSNLSSFMASVELFLHLQ